MHAAASGQYLGGAPNLYPPAGSGGPLPWSLGSKAAFMNYAGSPHGPTVQEIQLSGACDWYKIHKLVSAEDHLISQLRDAGLSDPANRLESMRDDLLAHRMAISPKDDVKVFLRNNCANDAYIMKWRNEIDKFDTILGKAMKSANLLPEQAIELRYQSQLLKQQARASLPFTGYYNPVAKTPRVDVRSRAAPPPHEPRFVYHPSPSILTKLSSFI